LSTSGCLRRRRGHGNRTVLRIDRPAPTKTDLAARLIHVEAEIVAPDKNELLSALHIELSDALGIPDEG
jgi:hypothetical protein